MDGGVELRVEGNCFRLRKSVFLLFDLQDKQSYKLIFIIKSYNFIYKKDNMVGMYTCACVPEKNSVQIT